MGGNYDSWLPCIGEAFISNTTQMCEYRVNFSKGKDDFRIKEFLFSSMQKVSLWLLWPLYPGLGVKFPYYNDSRNSESRPAVRYTSRGRRIVPRPPGSPGPSVLLILTLFTIEFLPFHMSHSPTGKIFYMYTPGIPNETYSKMLKIWWTVHRKAKIQFHLDIFRIMNKSRPADFKKESISSLIFEWFFLLIFIINQSKFNKWSQPIINILSSF